VIVLFTQDGEVIFAPEELNQYLKQFN